MARRVTTAERRIERLLWRAGFGPFPGEARRLAPLGVPAVVERLLHPRGPQVAGPPMRIEGAPLDPVNVYGQDSLWWLDRCIRTRQPLAERMTLNWHDHFATSNAKVGDVRQMMAHYRVLRRGALGGFRGLAHALLRDTAMQRWLDLSGSEAGSPNENFARELFELFTLGVNNGYTERDIREAARALTGFTYDHETRRAGYDPERHDGGVKRILGRRGRFTPHQVVDLAIDHPAHAPYLCRTLWRYFTPRPVPPATLRAMVRAYRGAGTAIRPVLRIILTHPTLYADLDEPDQVKPPVVYLAGMVRRTGRPVPASFRWQMQEMGQRPFYPPNVAGWDQDTAWLSPATVRTRFQAAGSLLDDSVEDGSVAGTQSARRAVEAAMRATGRPLTTRRTATALERYARRSVAGRDSPWEVDHYFAERQRVLRHLLLAGPDAQVC
jgi:uncharacterized protein (DUF1800 family)